MIFLVFILSLHIYIYIQISCFRFDLYRYLYSVHFFDQACFCFLSPCS
jgi:hypothetical protein